jgi:hypothetical protein
MTGEDGRGVAASSAARFRFHLPSHGPAKIGKLKTA